MEEARSCMLHLVLGRVRARVVCYRHFACSKAPSPRSGQRRGRFRFCRDWRVRFEVPSFISASYFYPILSYPVMPLGVPFGLRLPDHRLCLDSARSMTMTCMLMEALRSGC
ncbi:hypothetical protein FA95DRAFT_938501 [Auriscalpium vulgare]|uniref:Uncharacterized protein n=1 Tax=Auriscalpium vulgare TaxID=40419 RepID=A0ACB8SB57_9AGAM|nr:hypothetical protein FA95DRAFT_938501 [Auriscalpium vulgare]